MACAGLVDGRSRRERVGQRGRRRRQHLAPEQAGGLAAVQATRRSCGCARRKPAKSLAPRCGCRRPGCLRARTLAARPTRPRRPASSAPAARHSPAPDRSPGSRPRSARRRCADAHSSGPGAARWCRAWSPAPAPACGVVTGRSPAGPARPPAPPRPRVARGLAGRPAAGALSVFSCRKDSAAFADVDCRTAQARCAMPARDRPMDGRDRPMDGTVLASGGTTAMAGPPLSSYS